MTQIERAKCRVDKAHAAYLASVAEFNATVDAEDAKAKAKKAAIEADAVAQKAAIEAKAKLAIEAVEHNLAAIITPEVRQHTRAYVGVGPIPGTKAA